MNRVINVLSFFFAGSYCVIAIALVYDLSVSSATLKGMLYKFETTSGLALIVLLLGLLRIKRRWIGMKDIREFGQFTFSATLSKTGRNHALTATVVEVSFMVALLVLCSQMAKIEPLFSVPMMAVVGILALEGIIFAVKIMSSAPAFRIGVSPQVVALFNREIHLFYFTGLKRIELLGNRINFQYRDNLNIILPIDQISPGDRRAFRDALIAVLEPKNIFIDDAFRSFE